MIPIRDTVPSKNYPIMNNTLIGVSAAVFLIQMFQGDPGRFVYIYGLVPARYSIPEISHYFTSFQQVFSLISFMFLHGGFWHLLGNMWSLYIFGDNVEDSLGHLRYLVFYLLCGMASGLSHLALNSQSEIPTVGASGAIAGVMGAYFLLYPGSRILTLIPIIIIPWMVEIPAFIFLGVWFVMQMLYASGSNAAATGIAWWAHVGGFVFGVVFLKILQAYPAVGAVKRFDALTTRKKTERLQVIRTAAQGDSPHMVGNIMISTFEAMNGTRKVVNIPWGFHNRLFRVTVPPGTTEGAMLRLGGLGKIMPDGQRGDLYLKVVIR